MLERSAEQAAAQKEAELKALEARAAAEKAATVERAAAEKAAAEDKVAMLERSAAQAAAQKEAELQRATDQIKQLQSVLLERGRPDAAPPPPRSAAEAGGAEAPEHAAVRGREEAELHALRAELSAVKAEHATAAAELESAKQHAQQMKEAFKTSIEAANRYGRRMEDDRERLQQEVVLLREQLASLGTAAEEKASALREQLGVLRAVHVAGRVDASARDVGRGILLLRAARQPGVWAPGQRRLCYADFEWHVARKQRVERDAQRRVDRRSNPRGAGAAQRRGIAASPTRRRPQKQRRAPHRAPRPQTRPQSSTAIWRRRLRSLCCHRSNTLPPFKVE